MVMNPVRALVGLLAAIICCAHAGAQDEEVIPAPGQYNLKVVPFGELSERHVSRQGDAALKIEAVKWEHSESDHFIFHTETGFLVTQLVSAAEWSYAGIKKDLGITQDSFERKCHLYVFLNEQAWREFVGTGKMDAWTGGWCTGRELFFWSRPSFKFQGQTLPHELTHLVLHRFVGGDIPLWLNEGLAEFEGIRIYRAYLKARQYALTNVPDHLSRDQYIPLKDLTSAIDYPKSKDEVMVFYTESQRLVSFLYYQHGGMAPLMKLVKLQSEGARFDSAWREVYGSKYSDQQAFEDKFIAYLTKEKE
jgi:hypothetical protein